MQLTSRAAVYDDVDALADALFDPAGHVRHMVKREWRVLMEHPTLSVVIEDRQRPPGRRIIGCAQVAFVTDAFVCYLRSGAPPWVIALATEPLPDGSWPLLDREDVRAANSGEGLNALMTRWGLAHQWLSDEEATIAAEFLTRTFAPYYQGFKFKVWVAQTYGVEMRARALYTGFHVVDDYTVFFQRNPPAPEENLPCLLSVTRQQALAQPGSIASHAFTYTPPRFFFKSHEQEMLLEALFGASDERLAAVLGVTVGAIKKRWLAVYERVAEIDYDLLPSAPEDGGRGAEKWSILLRYLHEHPEELRPLLSPRGRKRRGHVLREETSKDNPCRP